jgi:hypothetical protein
MEQASRMLALGVFLTVVGCQAFATVRITSKTGIRVTLDGKNKTFKILVTRPRWVFSGDLDGTISGVRTLNGVDRIGKFKEIVFTSRNGITYRCRMRSYENRPVVLFQQEAMHSLPGPPSTFPVFTKFPKRLSLMTFSEREFGAPPVFRQFDSLPDSDQGIHSGPLLLYDSLCNACILSPASNFMIASTEEDGSSVHCGLNPNLVGIPPGLTQSTILVVEPGINRAWETWGRALTDLYRKTRPANDADVSLKYIGYWTDNGATYYYRYDTTKGYAGTLLALKKRYDEQRVPIRYLQLDSWWYPKGYDNPDGSVDTSKRRIADLPAGDWNRFGGLLNYKPSSELFPGGLRKFRDSVNLPLITHNRWISLDSPYRSKYKISGLGATDQRWWDGIMKSISGWGVATYEQDWLDRIYRFSPEFSSTTWAGEEFMNAMAGAAHRHGLTMQYCMPLPRHFLQGGTQYSNLTTIRVSGDRFQRDRWKEFLYGSRLASALGIWPWSDVFMSKETPNILLATLSAGMVGIGDAAGEENIENIARSVRGDGVIVKPDVPLVPIDRSYVSDARRHNTRIATTYSDHGKSLKTLYVFAFSDSANDKRAVVSASDIGLDSKMFMYDYFSKAGKIVQPGDSLDLDFARSPFSYVILAPIGQSGIGFVGDTGQFVTCGKKRIQTLVESKSSLRATVLLSKGEKSVSVCGYASEMPQFLIYGGYLTSRAFDPASHMFTIEVKPQESLKYRIEHGDAVGRIIVEFRKRA